MKQKIKEAAENWWRTLNTFEIATYEELSVAAWQACANFILSQPVSNEELKEKMRDELCNWIENWHQVDGVVDKLLYIFQSYKEDKWVQRNVTMSKAWNGSKAALIEQIQRHDWRSALEVVAMIDDNMNAPLPIPPKQQ